MSNKALKIGIVVVVLAAITAFFVYDGAHYLSLDYAKGKQAELAAYYAENMASTIAIYMVVYVISTALSFPGATVLTLLGGALFGTLLGTVIVSVASTVGATFAFLAARFLLRDFVQAKFADKLRVINEGIERDGDFYLFSLRLVPVVPFFVINLAMGLTPIKTWRFFLVSQVGMLLGTAVYVNAGTQLAHIDSLKGVLSPELIASFVALGILPLVGRKILQALKKRKG